VKPKDPPFLKDRVTLEDASVLKDDPVNIEILEEGVTDAAQKKGWWRDKPEDPQSPERIASADNTISQLRAWLRNALLRGRQKELSRRPRKRGPRATTILRRRALSCVFDEFPEITENGLIDKLEADGDLTYEDEDIKLSLSDGTPAEYVIITDLALPEDDLNREARITAKNLGSVLSADRKSPLKT
jgi:hypothetical protein